MTTIQRLEACNGLDDNRESCSATPAPPNAVGCDGCKCDNGSCQSSDRECRVSFFKKQTINDVVSYLFELVWILFD